MQGGETNEGDSTSTVASQLVDRALELAASALSEHRLSEAVKYATEGLEVELGSTARPRVIANILSCRSAAHAAASCFELSLDDARDGVATLPTAQGFLLLGSALSELHSFRLAQSAFQAGMKLEGSSEELLAAVNACAAGADNQAFQEFSEISAAHRKVCTRLRRVRESGVREEIMSQWRSTMTAPEWDAADYEWRPTFLPEMKLAQATRSTFLDSNPLNQLYLAYAQRVGELEHPKRSIQVARDLPRLRAYKDALQSLTGARALVLEAGSGILPVMCAQAGAAAVLALERTEALAHVARLVCEDNGVTERVRISTLGQARDDADAPPYDVVVTGTPRPPPPRHHSLTPHADMFDNTLLGMRIFEALAAAVKAGLVTQDTTVVPKAAVLRGALIEMRLGEVSGIDLRAMNSYRWHPIAQELNLAHEPHQVLSDEFCVSDIDFAGWLKSLLANNPETSHLDASINVEATSSGTCNAVAVWFDLALNESELSSRQCSSWRQAVYYLPERSISKGESVDLSIRHDCAQLNICYKDETERPIPRHSLIPHWHFDMLNDGVRNDAYSRAISKAIERKKAELTEVRVIDLGAGSGLLGMMAAKAGADSVVGVELSTHMCSIADAAIAANQLLHRCSILQGDARRMFAADSDSVREGRKPDGSTVELDRRADVCVFEVFDSGLIGEGALHLSAVAEQRLLLPSATIIPASARMFCQPIQFRVSDAAGVNVRRLNRFNWRPDYEGVELARIREQWSPLAPPGEMFAFSFLDSSLSVPRTVQIPLTVQEAGTVNAIAVWFELSLDAEEMLSTSPYQSGKGPTWQQAVMFVEEIVVSTGDTLVLEASHDTYSVSCKVANADSFPKGEPLSDPAWLFAHNRLASANSELMKGIIQSPLEYRAAAQAALEMGCHPGAIGVDVADASAFFQRMFA